MQLTQPNWGLICQGRDVTRYRGKRRRRPTRRETLSLLAGCAVAGGYALIAPDAYSRILNRVLSSSGPVVAERRGAPHFPAAQSSTFSSFDGYILPIGKDVTPDVEPPFTASDLSRWSEVEFWCNEAGAVPASDEHAVIRLDISSPLQTLVITGLEPVIMRRADPVTGALVARTSGGDYLVKIVSIDLDADIPVFLPTREPNSVAQGGAHDVSEDREDAHAISLRKFPISIGPADTLDLTIQPSTEKYYCEWKLRVHYRIDGRNEFLDYGGGDGVFRISSSRRCKWRWAGSDLGGWVGS
ncbi:hypothetical protein BJY21_003095 [Kineosphaera limosa]|nr:hypothetical protein [Kineosphaera limosa]